MGLNFFDQLDEGYPTRDLMLDGTKLREVLKKIRSVYVGPTGQITKPAICDYIAVHSNLLLEDFLFSLRNALEKVKKQARQEIDDAFVYEKVKLVSLMRHDTGGKMCKLQFPPEEKRRPSFGHLLVFSRGSFDDDLFLGMVGSTDFDDVGDLQDGDDKIGEVDGDKDVICTPVCDHTHKWDGESDCESDDDDKSDGDNECGKQSGINGGNEGSCEETVVTLKLLKDYRPPKAKNGGVVEYVMLETKSFFFMYLHVLRALNRLSRNMLLFPLPKTILNCRADTRAVPASAKVNLFHRGFPAQMPDEFQDWLLDEASSLGMNDSQKEALKETFHGGISLIQGPPGTGKTFFGVRLVKTYLKLYRTLDSHNWHKHASKVGLYKDDKLYLAPPYLLVCQTNHALDNFLKKLLDRPAGDKKAMPPPISIVRVGGQCKNLRVTPYCLTEMVCRRTPKKKRFRKLRGFLRELHALRLERAQLRHNSDEHKVTPENAVKLRENQRRIRKLEKEVPEHYNQLDKDFRRKKMLEVLREADVIGMTTTGAAIRFDILRRLNITVVVVEEAAAVLEAHVVVSTPWSCKNLVMLGDHKQLQPCLTNHRLEKHRFNISLFERLINNDYPFKQLKSQHRMRPEIAALLKGKHHPCKKLNRTIWPPYSELIDVPGTNSTDLNSIAADVAVFFLNHVQKEYPAGLNYSGYYNPYEVKKLIQLAEHLVNRGGHLASDIAIITMYKAQKLELKKARNKIPIIKNVAINTVDSFQGKEKKIILLSLVRSNKDGDIGFLKKPNRVCVALSRAKSGLFIAGDMNCLTKHKDSIVWKDVRSRMIQLNNNSIGTEWPLHKL